MQKEYFVDISDQLKKDFEDKNVFFDNRGNGVINIQISRNDFFGRANLCDAVSALIGENPDLDVVSNSIFMSSLGLDGSMLIFKKPRTWKDP